MFRGGSVLVASVAFLAITALTAATPAVDGAVDTEAVRAIMADYQEALNAGNLDGRVAMSAPNAVFMPNEAPPQSGLDAIRTYDEESTRLNRFEATFTPTDIEGSPPLVGRAPTAGPHLGPVQTGPTKVVVVTQPTSPVRITEYRAKSDSDGVWHVVTYTNRHTRNVVAVRFGFVEFDVRSQFSTKIDGNTKRDLPPGESQKGVWHSSPHDRLMAFRTGLAYVDTVRLEGGTTWQADVVPVLWEIWKIDESFDPARLRGGKGAR